MKTALILISLISLVSFFTLSSFKTNESLRSSNSNCYSSVLDLGAKVITISNSCKQKEIFQFSLSATFPNDTQYFSFETQCLQPGDSQVFEINIESTLGIFTQAVGAQIDC
ncbi:hypothetical protein ABPG72_020561 [Tetrahymena utriculariae]